VTLNVKIFKYCTNANSHSGSRHYINRQK